MSKPIKDGLTRGQRYYRRHPERRNVQARKYRAEHPEMVRRWVRRRKRVALGVDEAGIARLLAGQNYKCGICGTAVDEASHLDHNHFLGTPRGMLCRTCNLALGNFSDSENLLMAAILYLRRWR